MAIDFEKMLQERKISMINEVAKEWQDKYKGRMGTNGLDWIILDYIYEYFFSRNEVNSCFHIVSASECHITFPNSVKWDIINGFQHGE